MSETLTAELSLYPLSEAYVDIVEDYIDMLLEYDDLVVVPNAMSTQLEGPADTVFRAVQETLERSRREHGEQVLVCKFFTGARGIRD